LVQVESALLEHPAVEESAVVASPDVDRGQVVKAFVVLSRDYRKIKGRVGVPKPSSEVPL
jgi:acyl-coenzyme A synthetase/AMP-(fatty) acid ligase